MWAASQSPEAHLYQRFTERARQVTALANMHAVELQPAPRWWMTGASRPLAILPCHMLLGIVSVVTGVGYHAVLHCGGQPEELRGEIMYRLRAPPSRSLPEGTKLPVHPTTRAVIRAAIVQSLGLWHTWVGTEHMLLALCQCGEHISRRSLAARSVSYDKVLAFVRAANLAASQPRPNAAGDSAAS